jgi:hypothetical protein
VKVIRRAFLASLFFVLSVVLAIYFYPGISEQFSSFNSSVQGGVGAGSNAYFLALSTLDVSSALLCASALFYGAMLVARRKRASTSAEASIPAPAGAEGKDAQQSARFRRRLLLIPIWLSAQYVWNLVHGASLVSALEAMTSISSLWVSAVVVTVTILYARNYEVVFERGAPARQDQPTKPVSPER